MKPRAWIAALLCATMLFACDAFEKNAVQDIAGPVPAGAQIKFFNFGVNAPAVNFYADARKMTAINSATEVESNLGVAYGGVGAGGFYTAIAAGAYTLAGKIAAATDKDLAISNLPATLAEGKRYSFYQSGFYDATAKSVDAFIVEDAFASQIDYAVAYVRFVHAISNANPMTLYAWTMASPGPRASTAISLSPPRSFMGLSRLKRPALMMITRWQIASTSARMCVDSKMVRLSPSSLMRASVSRICTGSRPTVGSSRMRILGSWIMASASPTRWR